MNNLKLLKSKRRAENRAVYMMLETPDGKVFKEFLERMDSKILKKTPDGVVDPYAMAYAAGSHDLIKLIEDMANNGQLAR